jgi:acyl-CoA thioesterase I
MRRRVLLALVVFAQGLMLGIAGCGKPSPQLPKVETGDTVLAFGDSLTFGTGASPDESYPSVLERLIGRKVVRAGVPGEATEQGLARLPGVLEEFAPRLVILCLGGNDLLQHRQEASIVSNLRAMIRLAREHGIAVVLLAPPRPALLTSAPPFYADLAKEFRIPLEAEVLTSVLSDNALKSDLIHPNAQGYAKVAEALAKLLKSAGAID